MVKSSPAGSDPPRSDRTSRWLDSKSPFRWAWSWAATATGTSCSMPSRSSRRSALAYEARVVSAHRTPDAMFAYAERARPRAGSGVHHRRRRRRCAPAGNARRKDDAAGAGRPDTDAASERQGFAAFDRADAQGRSGGDLRDRRSRCSERRRCSPIAMLARGNAAARPKTRRLPRRRRPQLRSR